MKYYRAGFGNNETRTVIKVIGGTVYYSTDYIPGLSYANSNFLSEFTDEHEEFHLISPENCSTAYSIF